MQKLKKKKLVGYRIRREKRVYPIWNALPRVLANYFGTEIKPVYKKA